MSKIEAKLRGMGYELPPPFVTHSFARFRKALLGDWSGELSYPKFRSRPEQFTIPRYGAARRIEAG